MRKLVCLVVSAAVAACSSSSSPTVAQCPSSGTVRKTVGLVSDAGVCGLVPPTLDLVIAWTSDGSVLLNGGNCMLHFQPQPSNASCQAAATCAGGFSEVYFHEESGDDDVQVTYNGCGYR